MKISNDALFAWNHRKELCYNDNWNLAQGWGTMAEHGLLSKINSHYNGLFREKLTRKQVNKWLETYGDKKEA